MDIHRWPETVQIQFDYYADVYGRSAAGTKQAIQSICDGIREHFVEDFGDRGLLVAPPTGSSDLYLQIDTSIAGLSPDGRARYVNHLIAIDRATLRKATVTFPHTADERAVQSFYPEYPGELKKRIERTLAAYYRDLKLPSR